METARAMGNANSAQIILEHKKKIDELTGDYEIKLKKAQDKMDKLQEKLDKMEAKTKEQEEELNDI